MRYFRRNYLIRVVLVLPLLAALIAISYLSVAANVAVFKAYNWMDRRFPL